MSLYIEEDIYYGAFFWTSGKKTLLQVLTNCQKEQDCGHGWMPSPPGGNKCTEFSESRLNFEKILVCDVIGLSKRLSGKDERSVFLRFRHIVCKGQFTKIKPFHCISVLHDWKEVLSNWATLCLGKDSNSYWPERHPEFER